MGLSAQTPARRAATLADFLAIPPHERFHEIIDGELVRKLMPSFGHAHAQRKLGAMLDPYTDDGLRGQPGGWWVVTEAEILLPPSLPLRPDLSAWRWARMPEPPVEFPVKLLPDWICEVVSPSDPRRDTIVKARDYGRAGVPHYWLVDLAQQTLTALRLSGEHYVIQAEARAGERVRLEPFDLVEIDVGKLFGAASQRS